MTSFDTFKTAFKGDIVTPSEPGYDDAITRWAANTERRAKVVAFVRDAEDVVLALKYARSEGLSIAVKGGGHSASGASSSGGGLVIDLSRYVNNVRIHPPKKLAYVGGGSLMGTVDSETVKHGLAAVGGTVSHTGIGGLVLGGGYGWLTGEHGLAIDNLDQVTIITADGSILTANENKNEDLFWGVRGGGGNFGVVMEFVLRLHEQPATVFAGSLIFQETAINGVANAAFGWWSRRPSGKEGITFVMSRGPDGRPCIIAFLFYNGPEAAGRRAFKALLDLNPAVNTCGEIPFEKANTLQDRGVPHGFNFHIHSVAHSTRSASNFSAVFSAFVSASADQVFRMSIVWEFLPHERLTSIAHNATAFPGRGSHGTVNVTAKWLPETEKKVPSVVKAAHEAVSAVSEVVTQDETDPNAAVAQAYANYAGDTVDNPEQVRAYFRGNYPRLQQLKKKYDPDVVFSTWFVISPSK